MLCQCIKFVSVEIHKLSSIGLMICSTLFATYWRFGWLTKSYTTWDLWISCKHVITFLPLSVGYYGSAIIPLECCPRRSWLQNLWQWFRTLNQSQTNWLFWKYVLRFMFTRRVCFLICIRFAIGLSAAFWFWWWWSWGCESKLRHPKLATHAHICSLSKVALWCDAFFSQGFCSFPLA